MTPSPRATVRVLGVLVAGLVLHASPAAAQTFYGGIRGIVRSRRGTVLRSVSVQLTEQNRGLTRTTVSNDAGQYVFARVSPGTYAVRATARGYKAFERAGVRLDTQAFLTVDILLDAGSLTDTVIVRGETPLLQTSTASIGTLLTQAMLDRLPNAGRNIFYTATITPTVVPTGDSRFVRQQDQTNSSLISMAGGPRRDNSYVVDGVPIVDILNRATFIPSFQAVEEMRVQLAPYDAEAGRTSGGVFNVIGRSGTNDWHGTSLYQNRPDWAQARSFFAAKADIPNDTGTYYRLYGGGVGGPIVRDRTFLWASTEGYRSLTTRSAVMVLPTEAERRGDFSQSAQVVYDPLTTRPDPSRPGQFIRDPFPGNQIPAARLNPVSLALLKYLPLPASGNSRPAVANLVDAADQVTGRITERWSGRLTSTGMFAWYGSTEPDPRFFGQGVFDNAADPGGGAFVRRARFLALNTTWTPGERTVVEMRDGFNQLLDDNRPTPFDPSGLGFDPAFLSIVPQQKFPSIGVAGYSTGYGFLGDRFQSTATYYAHDANVVVTTLHGRHSLKAGGEYRQTGVRFLNSGGMGGYGFDRGFTFGPDPNAPGAGTGDGFASFLLGYPSSGAIAISTPLDIFLNYWSGYAQDDVRVTAALTLTLGLRYEFEQGLTEQQDRISVGWAFDRAFPQQVGGVRPDGTPLTLTGGLVYAGVDGAPTAQGSANPHQFAPRAGVAYALGERTVLRAGYGVFYAPPQGISADEFGSATLGFNETTNYVATGGDPFVPCATCSLTDPFPTGIRQPVGSSLGALTGVGGTVEFVDPKSRMAHLHRYSFDLQRELPGRVAVDVGYLGALGRDLIGGIPAGGPLDINQLDRKYQALGTALQEPVSNPFYGTPLGVGILSSPTIPRGQLLRPYPQFDAVYMLRSNVARSRYDALIVSAEHRLAHGWSARADYTWSRQQDSQFSESNFFAGGSTLLDNYRPQAAYGLSALDVPQRLNVSGSVELPFGTGRRWLNRRPLANAFLGGWMISAVAGYQSGFPITIRQSPDNSNLLGSGQRPNVVPGIDPVLTGDPQDSYDASCGCIRWLNPAAWSQAPAFTFGNAPRVDGRARTAPRRMLDLAIEKSQRLARSTVAVRAEVINVLNFADLLGPDVAFGDATFGQIRQDAGFPRMLQLSARVTF
ncbi:MAG TPA: carboxypeptidase regulatory-like domain-containing protein [Vicinamibacterales bacterium]|nr:carboxypeptidase regulatory-like domain-containing protein [Vicinamibacterales bacterium]